MKTEIKENDILLIIDPQIDFCEGGNLAVIGGNAIMSLIVKIAKKFKNVIITQDWHPANAKQFATNNPGSTAFSVLENFYGPGTVQVLWPPHCIQGSKGADFHKILNAVVRKAQAIIRKGYDPDIDSHSAFFANDKKTSTGLDGYIRSRGLTGRIYIVGLAFDYCVGYSAIDARNLGYEVTVIKNATASIAPETEAETLKKFAELGIEVIDWE
jgi:nicotinamidase/pyrazinamidase